MVTGHNSEKIFNFSGGVIENGTATTGKIDGTAAKGTYNGDNIYINSAIMNITGGSIRENDGNAILLFALDDARPAGVNLTLTGNADLATALDGKVYAISGAAITNDLGTTEADADGDLIWYNKTVQPEYVTGDYTGNGVITNDDVVALLWHTLFPEENPVSIPGDLTGDGAVTNDDVVLLLWHCLFPEENPLP